MMHQAVLLIGGNEGDRLSVIQQCIPQLATLGNIKNTSSIYETEAWGRDDLPPHLNQGILLETHLFPNELLAAVKQMEVDLGRVPTEKWGIRKIDIDIIFYDELILKTDLLTIPHAWMHERRFVLIPLSEIIPNWIHPVMQQSVATLASQCTDPLWVTLFEQKHS